MIREGSCASRSPGWAELWFRKREGRGKGGAEGVLQARCGVAEEPSIGRNGWRGATAGNEGASRGGAAGEGEDSKVTVVPWLLKKGMLLRDGGR